MSNKKGFTLMEMLIVVAIIAILVAVAIPILSNSQEKAKETVDQANLRDAYAQILADSMLESEHMDSYSDNIVFDYDKANRTYKAIVNATQKDGNSWLIAGGSETILIGSINPVRALSAGAKWTITCDVDNAELEVSYGS